MINHARKHDGDTFLWNAGVRRLCLAMALLMAMAVVALEAPAPAEAQTAITYVSNLSQGNRNLAFSPTTSISMAQEFTTGRDPLGYKLGKITVSIRTASNGTAAIALHKRSGGRPGDKIVDLSGSVTVSANRDFTPASATMLDPSTSYFVVFGLTSGDSYHLHTTNSGSQYVESTGWSIADNSIRGSGTSWNTNTSTVVKMAVNASLRAQPGVIGVQKVGQKLQAKIGALSNLGAGAAGSLWQANNGRWQRLNAGTWSNISGATGKTYTLQTADVGKQVRFRITGDYPSFAYPVGSTVQASATPHLTGMDISSTPQLTSNTYGVGESIKFRIAFSGAVDVTGSPRLQIALGNQVRWAVYESGSGTDRLVFSHTVEASRHATGGIAIATASPVRNNKLGMYADDNAVKMTSIDLRSGTIRASGTTTDAILTNNHLFACCGWFPGHTVNADPNAASEASSADPPTITGAPAVSASGPDGEWGPGETVEVTLTFSEAVTVDTGGGTPSVGISLGGTAARSAAYLRGSGTTALVFGYTLTDADGSHTSMFVTPNGLALNDGTIRSKATGVDADLTHAGKAELGSARGTMDGNGKKGQEPQGSQGEVEQEPPPAPTGLTATVNDDGHVVLSWDAPDDDSVTGYQVLRRRPAEGENSLQVYVSDTGSTDTTYTDTSVTAGTQHVYRVKAINAAGMSDRSNYVNVTPQAPQEPEGAQGQQSEEEEVEPFTAALEGLPESHDGSTAFTFTLRFSREPDELSYRDIEAGLVYVKGATLSRVRRATPGSNQAWALTVTPNQNGDVVIRVLPRSCDNTLAFCSDGQPLAESVSETVPGPATATTNSGNSGSVPNPQSDTQQNGNTPEVQNEPQQPPSSPTNLQASVNTSGHVVLSWDAPDDDSVTGYVILRRRPGEGENSLQVYVADTRSTSTTYTDTNVTAGTQYAYRVKAINAEGQSGRSNYVNVTP